MKKPYDDFLVEIHTEELPPKALKSLAVAFCEAIKERLQKANLAFEEANYFAAPRRLAVLVKKLADKAPDQMVERKGPALSAAFNDKGEPSQACIGFARSCGITPDALQTIKTPQGEWVGYQQALTGKSVAELLPDIVNQAAAALPIPKRMRWGDSAVTFVRPVHSVVMLYGAEVIDGVVLGCKAGRTSVGHRFHAPEIMSITQAAAYEECMETAGHVMASFEKRRTAIQKALEQCVTKKLGKDAHALISSDAFLDEVTSLVEWPEALCGDFDKTFLSVPCEALISCMQDHQRYFPVVNAKGELLPHFVTISNIQSKEIKRVVHGNERVLRARLSDAAFFYTTDKKERLEKRIERLKGIVFQAKLGTLHDKAERVSRLSAHLAKMMGVDEKLAARAGLLAKADLTTAMVAEFPELQGVMGSYYARADGEKEEVAKALQEHYLPRFAGDVLPSSPMGQVVALADRIDTLVGSFSIQQVPTGDKDPYGLRRAALGVLRILIENKINLDLKQIILFALSEHANQTGAEEVLRFIQERLRAWSQDQNVTSDVFAAVAALEISNPLDVYERIKAVQAFKTLSEAETLSVANKRVSNILSKYTDSIDAKTVNPSIFETEAEKELARQLETKDKAVQQLYQRGDYDQVLVQLAALRQPIDDFFDQVMVITEDKAKRENRLLLLKHLRALFLQVADIALLQ